jgi:hypothetical protein
VSGHNTNGNPLRLAACPSCGSTMIYPIDLAGWDCDAVVTRRCPECEHRDVVQIGRLPAMLWFDRNARLRLELSALGDAIADGLPLDGDLARTSRLPRDNPHPPSPESLRVARRGDRCDHPRGRAFSPRFRSWLTKLCSGSPLAWGSVLADISLRDRTVLYTRTICDAGRSVIARRPVARSAQAASAPWAPSRRGPPSSHAMRRLISSRARRGDGS